MCTQGTGEGEEEAPYGAACAFTMFTVAAVARSQAQSLPMALAMASSAQRVLATCHNHWLPGWQRPVL